MSDEETTTPQQSTVETEVEITGRMRVPASDKHEHGDPCDPHYYEKPFLRACQDILSRHGVVRLNPKNSPYLCRFGDDNKHYVALGNGDQIQGNGSVIECSGVPEDMADTMRVFYTMPDNTSNSARVSDLTIDLRPYTGLYFPSSQSVAGVSLKGSDIVIDNVRVRGHHPGDKQETFVIAAFGESVASRNIVRNCQVTDIAVHPRYAPTGDWRPENTCFVAQILTDNYLDAVHKYDSHPSPLRCFAPTISDKVGWGALRGFVVRGNRARLSQLDGDITVDYWWLPERPDGQRHGVIELQQCDFKPSTVVRA